jgi:uncharacterized membrane protein
MEKKTVGIIATIATALLCGCPGIFLCVFGIWGATGTMPYTTEIGGITGGGTMPSTVGFVLLFLSLIFIAIPIVVGFVTLRKKPAPATLPEPAEPLPPTS